MVPPSFPIGDFSSTQGSLPDDPLLQADRLAKQGQGDEAMQSLASYRSQSFAARSAYRKIEGTFQAQNARYSLGLLQSFFLDAKQAETPAVLDRLAAGIHEGKSLPDAFRALSAQDQAQIQGKVGQEQLTQIFSISQNLNPESFWTEAIHLGVRLKQDLELEKSAAILSFASQDYVPAKLRQTAQAEFDSIIGKGSSGLRSEVLIGSAAHEATNFKMIFPMLGATVAGQVVGTAVLGELAGGARGAWYSSGLGARALAGTAGFLAEVPLFAMGNRALNGGEGTTIGQDLSRSAISLGVLRLFSFAGNQTFLKLHGFNEFGMPTRLAGLAKFDQAMLPQAFVFGGLMLSHKIEQRYGLRPQMDDATTVTDTFGSMLSMTAGSYLGHSLLGRGFADFQKEMGLRANIFTKFGGPPSQASEPAKEPALVPMRFADNVGLGPVMMMMSGMGGGGSDDDEPTGVHTQHVNLVKIHQQTGKPVQIIHPPVQQDPLIGRTINERYKIIQLIGQGGMGAVYLVEHTGLKKKYAMKILLPKMTENLTVATRFLKEGEAAARIGHPNIVSVTDSGNFEDGSFFIVMEHLKGNALSKEMDGQKQVPANRLIPISRQIADGLLAAHNIGIVHRDLKPDNVFLSVQGRQGDVVKILDFGIAKHPETEETKLTKTGEVFGSPDYMSPEQIAGDVSVDARSDIYALGVMMYEMATGKLPFGSGDPNKPAPAMQVMTKHLYNPPPPMSTMAAEPQNIPQGLEDIVLKCLEKKPEARYQSMQALMDDLDNLQKGLTPVAVTERRRWPLFAVAGFGVATLLGTAGVLAFGNWNNHDTKAPVGPPVPSDSGITPPEKVSIAQPPAVTPKKISKVVLTTDPQEAHVYQGDVDLGSNPLISVEDGAPVDLVIRSKGFKDKPIKIDGSKGQVSFKLDKAPSVPSAAVSKGTPPDKPKPKPSGDLINPWK